MPKSVRKKLALGSMLSLCAGVLFQSCIARPEGTFQKPTDDDAGKPGPIFIDGSSSNDAKGDLPPADPHAVLGVDPPHGPWNGGQTVIVRGNGFTSKARVWFGTQEIPESDLVPIDAERVQVVAPPGTAGAVNVTVQNGDDASTTRTLIGGYEYDSFYAAPKSGPTSGGTLVTLFGQGTNWNDKAKVLIDFLPCTDLVLKSPTELTCKTPGSTPGTKPIRVTTEDGVSVDVLDAFTFGDSDDGFKGGLSGGPLSSQLKVIALDGFTGEVLPLATVIAGDDLATALVKLTDVSGVTLFSSTGLGPKRTVTVAKKCYQPITFVDVPVDTVTVYLDPVLSPSCAEEGDPPPVGGTPLLGAAITGQLVWKSQKEFEQRAAWTNVPDPKGPDEKLAAYVFPLSSDPTYTWNLPSPAEAVTPESGGSIGYAYVTSASTGNLGLYALAGIENRTANPPYFKAYAMGIAKGVSTSPGKVTSDVYINMDIPLDHAFQVALTGPKPTLKGPDRARVNVAVRVNELGYALLPIGEKEKLLPVGAPISFVGVPPLIKGLATAQYVYTGSAVTGAAGTSPRSVVGLLATQNTAQAVSLDPFVEIPTLEQPSTNGAFSGTELAWGAAAGGQSVELHVITIQSGGGLVNWTVAAPGNVSSTHLPNLAALGAELALQPGAITIGVVRAHIDPFDYGALRYRQLDSRGWNAYASDIFHAHL
ncbi:MAG: IPT/TIG domain-containing protein [Polyangiaceae bacterium]